MVKFAVAVLAENVLPLTVSFPSLLKLENSQTSPEVRHQFRRRHSQPELALWKIKLVLDKLVAHSKGSYDNTRCFSEGL